MGSSKDQVEEIARNFHMAYERYAPQYDWATQVRSRVVWEEVPQGNKELMVAVVNKLLIDGIIEFGPNIASGG